MLNANPRNRIRFRRALAVGALVAIAATIAPLRLADGQQAPSVSALPSRNVFVTNDATARVPVSPTPPPLWQGAPFVTNQVVLDAEFEKCEPLAVPAGMVLFAERAIVSLNTRQGGRGGARIEVKLLGEEFPDRIPVPTHPSSPQAAVDGNLDGYEGSVELGMPITAASACFRGTEANGDMTLIGFLMPA